MKGTRTWLALVAALGLMLLNSLPVRAAPPTRWYVNGNGYVGLLDYRVNPNDMSVSGALLGTPCQGFMVGRRLVLHRKPRGTQIWEGWVMEPAMGAPGQSYYQGGYFIAGAISEGKANNSLYPWYGVPATGAPPWNTGGGGGGIIGGGGGGITGGGGGGITGGGGGGTIGGGGGTIGGGGGGDHGGGHNLLANPSFEQGGPVGRFITLRDGSTGLPGWSVGGHSIDVVGTYWKSSHGDKSVDLHGSGVGRISQSFNTQPGHHYQVVFDLAANPACGSPTKTVHVDIAGVVRKKYSASSQGNSLSKMGWTRRSFIFIARGNRTTISFIAAPDPGGSQACGPAVDNTGVYLLLK